MLVHLRMDNKKTTTKIHLITKEENSKMRVLRYAAISLLFGCIPASAQSIEDTIDLLKTDLSIESTDEGKDSKCITREGLFNTCVVRRTTEYLTNPKDIKINVAESNVFNNKLFARGNITYDFDCRVRTRRKDAGIVTQTGDSNKPGSVLADFLIAYGQITIDNVKKNGSVSRCGNAIIQRLNSY